MVPSCSFQVTIRYALVLHPTWARNNNHFPTNDIQVFHIFAHLPTGWVLLAIEAIHGRLRHSVRIGVTAHHPAVINYPSRDLAELPLACLHSASAHTARPAITGVCLSPYRVIPQIYPFPGGAFVQRIYRSDDRSQRRNHRGVTIKSHERPGPASSSGLVPWPCG